MLFKKSNRSVFPIILSLILLLPMVLSAQLPCSQPESMLSQLVGNWQVTSTDRISPGEYQENTGKSSIRSLFDECGVEENYRGMLKGEALEFKTLHVWKDSVTVSKLWLDSNHANPMLLEGKSGKDSLVVMWQRQLKTRLLSVKHVLRDITKSRFVSESYMRPREGAGWQLTHRNS
ncbi:MAG: DUF1579 family protein [Calditrichota bacterium]